MSELWGRYERRQRTRLIIDVPEEEIKNCQKYLNGDDCIIDNKVVFGAIANGVPERGQGEWIFDGFCGCFGYDNNCKCHCSKCNKKIIVDGVYVVGKGYRMNPEGRTPNFCSNCGAKMKGVKNGEIE